MFVSRIRGHQDWTGPDPTIISSLNKYVRDHKGLVPFVDYGGKRRWDGFHLSSHPAPTLTEASDYAADRILRLWRKGSKEKRSKKFNQGRNRRTKRLLKALLVDGLHPSEASKKLGVSTTLIANTLKANSPDKLAQLKSDYLSKRRTNSQWGQDQWRWLFEKLAQPPHEHQLDTFVSSSKANLLRAALNTNKLTNMFDWSLKRTSPTVLRITGTPNGYSGPLCK